MPHFLKIIKLLKGELVKLSYLAEIKCRVVEYALL